MLFGTLDKLLLESTPADDPGGHATLLNSLRPPRLPK